MNKNHKGGMMKKFLMVAIALVFVWGCSSNGVQPLAPEPVKTHAIKVDKAGEESILVNADFYVVSMALKDQSLKSNTMTEREAGRVEGLLRAFKSAYNSLKAQLNLSVVEDPPNPITQSKILDGLADMKKQRAMIKGDLPNVPEFLPKEGGHDDK